MDAPLTAGVAGQVQQGAGKPFVPERAVVEVDIKIWYKQIERRYDTVYEATFSGDYAVVNPSDEERSAVALTFPLPTGAEMVWNAKMDVDDNINKVEPESDEEIARPETRTTLDAVRWSGVFEPGEQKDFHITYIVRGQQEYSYLLDSRYQMPHFSMVATIHGATEIDLPPDILPLSREPEVDTDANTIALKWYYEDVLTTKHIRITLPTREPEVTFADRLRQHEPLFQSLMGASPLFAVLFLGMLWLAMHMAGTQLSKASYILLGIDAILLAPLTVFGAALLGTRAAFWIALAVVTVVAVMYARIAGKRVARTVLFLMLVVVGGIAYGVLDPERKGLVLTLGGLVSLAYFMMLFAAARQVSGRGDGDSAPEIAPEHQRDPEEIFAEYAELADDREQAEQADGGQVQQGEVEDAMEASDQESSSEEDGAPEVWQICTKCGTELVEGYKFCPGCSEPVTALTITCDGCGAELCADCAADYVHCPRCGVRLRE
jgi:hypothetical protein